MKKEGYGIRLVLGVIENDRFFALEGQGQIIRDKARIYGKGEFSAWRVVFVKQGDEWIKYDGFDLDKIINNEDGLNNPDRREELDEEEDNEIFDWD